MKKFNNRAIQPIAMIPAAATNNLRMPPMPPRPYAYAAYKHEMDRKTPMVGDVIREWRELNKVDRKTLAFIATTIARAAEIPVKLTVADLNNYESRRCQPKIDKLTILAAAMGMTPEQLTGYNENKALAMLDIRKWWPAA